MILHSIIDPRDIFFNVSCPRDKSGGITYRKISGGILELSGGTVRRLISTDPGLFLDSRYFPDSRYK
ncbi:MAG: hypothetical protein J6X60_12340 [Ruminiclostridium sp.]|nr:hypothetical protein [Ruminiclostridium sp.]